MLGNRSVAGLAVETGVHRMPPVGELPASPGHLAAPVHSVVTGSAGSRLHRLPQVDGGQTWIGASGFGRFSRQPDSRPKEIVGIGDVVSPFTDSNQLHVLLGRLQKGICRRPGLSPQGAANLANCPGNRIHPSLHLIFPTGQNPRERDPVAGKAGSLPCKGDSLMARKLAWKGVAALTRHPGQEHPARVILHAVATTSRNQGLLGGVGSSVAVGAIELESLLQGHDLVLDLRVALLALDVVHRDVHLVEEGRVVELLEALSDIVAAPTTLFLGLSVPNRHVGVAFGA